MLRSVLIQVCNIFNVQERAISAVHRSNFGLSVQSDSHGDNFAAGRLSKGLLAILSLISLNLGQFQVISGAAVKSFELVVYSCPAMRLCCDPAVAAVLCHSCAFPRL